MNKTGISRLLSLLKRANLILLQLTRFGEFWEIVRRIKGNGGSGLLELDEIDVKNLLFKSVAFKPAHL